ncbi:MAG: GTPase [Desulfurococcales archaeon]|jgi:predicted GTPase|nr:GTPase [Desulfurococcales archaeon]
MSRRVVIIGAGGRDFHNFNIFFRDNPDYHVVAFVHVSQIPGLKSRRYPPELAGSLYPEGIPIYTEKDLEKIIRENKVDEAVISYSDLSYKELGNIISRVIASGASVRILGPDETFIRSIRPVIAVTAVKTGSGKSSLSRKISEHLKRRGVRFVVVRHPMVYKDPGRMIVQYFERPEDLDKEDLTIEEREEYEHYVRRGVKVLAGVDYGKILRKAEEIADVIIWDGGNNDWPFYRPDLMFTVVDAMRPEYIDESFPGEVNVRMSDVLVINKIDQVSREDLEKIEKKLRKMNPKAEIIKAVSEVSVDRPDLISGRRVLVIEDSPTVTHGGARYGAGYVAARKYGAREIIDPRGCAVGILRELYKEYPHMAEILPSTGYTEEQLKDLKETIERCSPDALVIATPSSIEKILDIKIPSARVSFDLKVVEGRKIEDIIDDFLEKISR